ncbi:MAG: hypothetical protein JSW52_05250, partial [Candidatus Coatesbacteria bacterium]
VLFERGFFGTGYPDPFVEYEDFFYIPPEDLGDSDYIEAEVWLSLTYPENTASFDDVFIEKVSERQDVNPVTVIPQPQAVVDLGFDTEPIKASSPNAWKIYHTYMQSSPPGKWQSVCERLSEDLDYEFDIGSLDVNSLTSSWTRPAIVVGDVDKGDTTFDAILEDLGGVSDYVTGNDEGYEMFVARDLIVIAATEPAGAFYGTQTLIHYLKEVPTRYDPEEHLANRVGYVPCGHIYDWPDMPLRGTMVSPFLHVSVTDYADFVAKKGKLDLSKWKMYRDWIRFLASMKVNALCVQTMYTAIEYTSDRPGNFPSGYGSGGTISNHEEFRWIYDTCRENFIEPVPWFGDMGSAAVQMLPFIPNSVEGRFIGKIVNGGGGLTQNTPEPKGPEEIDISDGEWHDFPNPFVIERNFDEFGGGFFKVEKYVNEEWVPATGLLWNQQGAADYSWEYIPIWFEPDDKHPALQVPNPEDPRWPSNDDDVENDRNLRIKARDFEGSVRVFYSHVFVDEDWKHKQAFCAKDPDVEALVEDTIDGIFDYLAPIKYFHINHNMIQRMRTCPGCYDAPAMMVGGKTVTPCGNLFGSSLAMHYDAITDAANEYQPGLLPLVFIWGDCFIWNNVAITFAPNPEKYRPMYGYDPDDDGVDVNTIGLDSARWLMQGRDRTVVHPWEYSINMMNVDGEEDVVPKWTMTRYAREVVEGVPMVEYKGYEPPYDEYPQFRLLGCPAAFPERFINYGQGPSKQTMFYMGFAGAYVALQLLNEMPVDDEVINKSTGFDDSGEESILKTKQAIDGSLWRHVPGYTDEWPIPGGQTEQEDWYYVERGLGTFPGGYLKSGKTVDDIDYARFRVHFDSLVYDSPADNPSNPILFEPGAGGRFWCDDAKFYYQLFEEGNWVDHEYEAFTNSHFHDTGDGQPFDSWEMGSYKGTCEAVEAMDDRVYREAETGPGGKSCRYDRFKVLENENYYTRLTQEMEDFGDDFTGEWGNTRFKLGLHVRAKYVDTYRLAGVWQWQYILDRYDYLKSAPDRENALGIITYAVGNPFYNRPNNLPENPGGWPDGDALEDWDFNKRHEVYKYVNGRAADAATAEWCWSLNKPRKWDDPDTDDTDEGIYDTPKLDNLSYCPYYIHQRERTWFEKK